MPRFRPPTITLSDQHHAAAVLGGAWLVCTMTEEDVMPRLSAGLQQTAAHADLHWDLSQITALDTIGAQMLWRAWDKRRPRHLVLRPEHEGLFARLEQVSALPIPRAPKPRLTRVMLLGRVMLSFFEHLYDFVGLLGQLALDLLRFARHPLRGPWKEISSNIYRTGFQALGITALVGALIGVVLSYLSSNQLRNFGGDVYLVNILGMGIIRELGPMLAAILVAGRSGSAITAQLGVMRVTEELDAMTVMGIPQGYRLIMPKVVALAIAMPLLVIWTDAMALLGGMLAAQAQLDMSPAFFLNKLPEAVALSNYWLGLGKGVVFGILIALVACQFGLRIQPNTESLGQGTTSSVVISITVVILADAVFAVIFSNIGY
ncbi:MlaE family ABC transporter permease [Undibacterium sp.]|jgi:phospholipid/cholesterol/gamma-HCH transport system permease protein|uniref:MlaE family ABC transporter permease n=1 Tax=Undibacterium sp. TaxID=1914977 RepID=UPI0039C8E21B